MPFLPVLHISPPPGLPSSALPLQLSSRPLHASVVGCWFWLQTIPPLWQSVVPAPHTPSLPVLHAWPPPGLPLSTAPLQSSSRPLHTSALACTFCTQLTTPAWHAVVPG